MITKLSDIKHASHTIDAKNQVLGRLATKVATLLVGKNKPYFTRHLDCGDFVTVTNAKEIKTTGNKDTKKIYTRYTGYPGGLRKKSLKDLKEKDPNRVVYSAISGMLPNNKLKKFWIARLSVEN